MGSTSYFIPDTSPLLAYSGAWLAAYHPKGDGYDQTFHQTQSSGSVAFNLTGTSFRFSTPNSETSSRLCDVQYRINGSDWTTGCDVSNLKGGLHMVELKPSGTYLQLFGIGGTLMLSSGGKYHNVTVDNLSPAFSYTGDWTQLTSSGSGGDVKNETAADQYANRAGLYNESLSLTTSGEATVNFRFKGEAIYLYGVSGSDFGVGAIRLDGEVQSMLNMTLPWKSYSSLLFSVGGLQGDVEHALSFTNLSPGSQAAIDYAIVTRPCGPSTPNLGVILGAAAGGVAFTLLLCVLLYCSYSKRRASVRLIQARDEYWSPIHKVCLSGTSPKYPDYPLPYKDSLTPKSLARLDKWHNISPISPVSTALSPRNRAGAFGSAARLDDDHSYTSSPSGYPYPNYIPYNGPVQARPPSTSPSRTSLRDVSVRAPQATLELVGASTSASHWLRALDEPRSEDFDDAKPRESVLSDTGSVRLSGRYMNGEASNGKNPASRMSPNVITVENAEWVSPIRPPPPIRQTSHERETVELPYDVPRTAADYFSLPLESARSPSFPRSGGAHGTRDSMIPLSSAGSRGSELSRALIRTASRLDMSTTILNGLRTRPSPPAPIRTPRSGAAHSGDEGRRQARKAVPSFYTASMLPLDSVYEVDTSGLSPPPAMTDAERYKASVSPALKASNLLADTASSGSPSPYKYGSSPLSSESTLSTQAPTSPTRTGITPTQSPFTGSSHDRPRAPSVPASAIPSSAALHSASFAPSPRSRTPTASTPTSADAELSVRRGVSIKSVKTVRSLFSAWLASSADAPALPTSAVYDTTEQYRMTARSDSVLFGDGVPRRCNSSSPNASGSRGGSTIGTTVEGRKWHGKHAPAPLIFGGRESQGGGGVGNMIIELNPNSPVTVFSRPPSEQPGW